MKAVAGLSTTWALAGLAVLMLVGYGNFVAFRQWQQGRVLSERGLITQAQVTATRVGRGSRGISENYFVDYRLPTTIDPRGSEHSASVSADLYRTARERGTLPVQYLPSRPSVQRLAAAAPDRSLLLWMGLLDVMVLGLAASILKGA